MAGFGPYLFGICFISAIDAPALASSRSSANYSITTDTVDSGGANTQSANYSLRGNAMGEFGAGSSDLITSANYTSKIAYVGQLSDMLDPITAVSRLTHGGSGAFDIDLPLLGPTGIECRNSVTNSYTVVFTFANTLTSVASVGATAIGGPAPTTSGNIDGADAHRYLVTVNGASNVTRLTISLNSVNDSDANSATAVQTTMGLLIGDTNGDSSVNSGDISQTKSKSGQSTDGTNFRNDANADGSLNSGDISLVKSKSGTALP